MKKLFTLSIAIFCVVAINAQGPTESGNGFLEEFEYPDSTVYEDVPYEGIGAEWGEWEVEPDSFQLAFTEEGKLKWVLGDSTETAMGLWELSLDLTGNTDIRFRYQFPADAEFGIWVEDGTTGAGGELFPEDFMLGLEDLMDYTLDLSAAEFAEVDLSNVAEIWIMGYTEAGGTFYLDDLVIGDAIPTGISGKFVESSFQVYPNPASKEFAIGVDAESVSIFNISGQEVLSVQNYQKGSSIDISELAGGYYIINADSRTQKLMVK
jgi:hypothetical protein